VRAGRSILGVVVLAVVLSPGCGDGSEGGSRLGQRLRGSGDLLDASDADSFARLGLSLGGQVGLTVGVVGSPTSQQLGSISTAKAWSTIKVAIADKVLTDAGGPGGLSTGVRRAINQAITESNNAAAEKLFEGLKERYGGTAAAARAVDGVLRESGDRHTSVSTQGRVGFSPYGQTDWALAEQHRLMSLMAGGCILRDGSASYVLQLMGEVVRGQRWGLGTSGVSSRFKGGWGPGPDGRYVVRQFGLLEPSKRNRVVVTMAAEPADGQFASGTRMLDQVARWTTQNVDFQAARARACP